MDLTKNNLVSYSDIKDKLCPYDLIAFRGGDIMSDLIAIMEEYEVGLDEFTHVGMIVTSDILPEAISNGKKFKLKPNHPYLFESTFTYSVPGFKEDAPDVITERGELGVQLRDLEEVIPRYIVDKTTKVAWCPLKNNPFKELPGESAANLKRRRRILRDSFVNFFRIYEDRLYQIDIDTLFAAMFPCLRFMRNFKDSVFSSFYNVLHNYGWAKNSFGPSGWQFCSELIANVYKDIGIIPVEFEACNVIPVDFFGCDRDGIPSLVENPMYFKDWDLPGRPAIHYDVELKQLSNNHSV